MLELKKGQKILKDRTPIDIRFGNRQNRKMLFSLLSEAGYVKVQRGGRTVVVKRNIYFK